MKSFIIMLGKIFLKMTSKGQIINVENFSNKLESTLSSSITTERQKYEHNMTVLASIGSISPFIGLFGTVWGIMNSFQSIAMSNNTSLAVVAPGIAEALFATALGLLAAIPAVAAYNKFLKDIDNLNDRAENFAQLILLYFIDEIEKKMIKKNNTLSFRKKKIRIVLSQINVTPFVDVMLVLLIVFMITAPLLTVGVKIDLPKTKHLNLTRREIHLSFP